MKRVYSLVAAHWRRVMLTALCSAVISLINGAFAWLVKPVVDDVLIKGDKNLVTLISFAVAAAFLIRGVVTYAQNYLMNSVGAKMVRDIRDNLYGHMVYMPLSRFQADTSGSIMSRIINDAGMLQNLLAFRVRDLFVSLGTIIVLTGIAMYRRLDLTLIAIVVLPFALYAVSRISRRLKKATKTAQKKISDITESLTEGLLGIKVIKAFTKEKAETMRFKRKNQDYYREFMRTIRLTELSSLVMEVITGLGVAVILFYGTGLVASGSMTSGDFFSFLTAVLLIYTPAKRLSQVSNGLHQSAAYLDRIDEVLHSPLEHEGNVSLPPMKTAIEFDSVSFKYDGRDDYALKGVSLKIAKGEAVALVGRSGSGKTTLADMLARFYVPTSGTVRIDGVDLKGVTSESLRSQIGIVSQNVFLFNDTISANIAYGRKDNPSKEDIQKASMAAYAHEFVEVLPMGYETQIGESGSRLSGGQRQRLSIARAILCSPPILILDEATSSLDAQSEQMVQKALDNLIEVVHPDDRRSRNTTVIIIAHRLSTIKKADRIVVMDKGMIAEQGSHEDLLALNGFYRKMHQLQAGPAGSPE